VSRSFLDDMAEASLERVRAARRARSEAALEREARQTPPPPPLRLDPSRFDLIAEFKLRSPAAGRLGAAAESVAARATEYARAGAAAVSVLTEPSRFDGSLEHLASAAGALAPLRVPAMRKDFLVDPYQVLEARAAGAGGVLVIVRMLSRAALDALLDSARSLGLFVLLEAFDARDLELVRELVDSHTGSNLLLAGVNCRDLGTLEVSPGRLLELAALLPPSVPCVAESGVTTEADAREIGAAGYELALVGSALMRGAAPHSLARTLLAAGRAGRAGRSARERTAREAT
jgi:indole-3-glycerol phosphate synthase